MAPKMEASGWCSALDLEFVEFDDDAGVSRCLNTASAIGERQMLPRQTKSTEIWGDREVEVLVKVEAD